MADIVSWDVFISHASEDKETVARPLARLLTQLGFKVWLDEFELTIGDKLRQTIDRGLSKSRWGVVILSPHFFAKDWTQNELEALIARETGGEKVVLPVWHRLSAVQIVEYSPLLAARLAANTSTGLDNVAEALARSMRSASTLPAKFEDGDVRPAFDLQERLAQLNTTPSGLEHLNLEQYWLQEFIGRGGTGACYRATNIALGQTVCIKVFYSIEADRTIITKATERGIRGLAALRNVNIAPVLDYGYVSQVEKTTPYIVYDLVQGAPLDDWSQGIQDDGSALKRRIAVAIDLAKALSAAHSCTFVGALGFQEKGVFHGDIKPSNVLVRNDDVPIILDFMMPDLQRLAGVPAWSYWERNRDGKYHYEPPLTGAYGTPGFMAPEQELDGIVLPESDVYSLGRTFQYLFWPSMSEIELAMAHHAAALNGIEFDLFELAGRMTKAQPAERISTMNEVASELNRISSQFENEDPAIHSTQP